MFYDEIQFDAPIVDRNVKESLSIIAASILGANRVLVMTLTKKELNSLQSFPSLNVKWTEKICYYLEYSDLHENSLDLHWNLIEELGILIVGGCDPDYDELFEKFVHTKSKIIYAK